MDAWVVFDLDGTLIESEQIWAQVRQRFVLAHGGRWHDGAQAAMIGLRTNEWAAYMHRDLGVALDPSEIAPIVINEVNDRLTRELPILPGAEAVLERLAAAYILGLATSAALPVAQTVLRKTGWTKFFAVVVSADEVARGKPAPDVYLRALQLLHADAARTAAVEDSGNGISSAHAAHLAVVAIPNRAYPPDAASLTLAACVLPSLDDLNVETIATIVFAPRGT
jgi:HAD superfamily hydrolase (TIGR01509 family)